MIKIGTGYAKIVAEKFGPNVKAFFEEKNIKIIEQKGKVRDALK